MTLAAIEKRSFVDRPHYLGRVDDAGLHHEPLTFRLSFAFFDRVASRSNWQAAALRDAPALGAGQKEAAKKFPEKSLLDNNS